MTRAPVMACEEKNAENISHALAARDFFLAADLLDNCAERLYLQGEMRTLLAWTRLLPMENLRAHPRLATSAILAFKIATMLEPPLCIL